jgi:putative protein-disulfide isomerase
MITPKLIYIGDPMCSWCWGAAEEISWLKNKYSQIIDFQLLMGGLKPSPQENVSEKLKHFLRNHWAEIAQLSGQPFNFSILEKDNWNYCTEPACRAVLTVRKMNPNIEFDFFKSLQQAFYVKGLIINQLNVLADIAEGYFLDRNEFIRLFESEDMIDQTDEEFYQIQYLGVQGFPTILLKINEKHHPIARGFEKFEVMDKRIEKNLISF